MNELAAALRARIGQGSISLADFMAASNAAYYAQGDVFGAAGDFITAPEISQCFGEIIGLWAAVTWQALGAGPFKLVECGPGRGTLMADALRAAAGVPGLHAAAEIHLVEQSPALRERQKQTLGGHTVQWHDDLSEVPPGPMIVVANEFLDALPVRQWQRAGGGWRERRVAVDPAGAFTWALGDSGSGFPEGPEGAIFEDSPAIAAVVAGLAQRLARDRGAALFIDYGHEGPALGETLQAVRRHAPAPVLAAPGQCDLTAHVDFSAVAAAAAGLKVFGPVEQGTWLRRLGIELRAERLARDRTPEMRDTILQGVRRLTDSRAMGSMFKVMGFGLTRDLRSGGFHMKAGAPPALSIPALELPGVRHGFFGRAGGGSDGLYRSNNCGFGSGDDRALVAANRDACRDALGLGALITVHQRHTPKVEIVTAPWSGDAPVADAMVTAVRGLGLGILTADCAPLLFADAPAGVVGATHAGWRGAFDGVIAATVAAMESLGARRNTIIAAVGPCIGQKSYEVGPEFIGRFVARDPAYARYFANHKANGHCDFDLTGFVTDAARAEGIGVTAAGRDTCAEEDTYFSYRRTTLRGEPDYGRQLSVIGLV